MSDDYDFDVNDHEVLEALAEARKACPTHQHIAESVMRSEAMMWLMVGSNHTEVHLDTLRQYWDAYIKAGGKTWGQT